MKIFFLILVGLAILFAAPAEAKTVTYKNKTFGYSFSYPDDAFKEIKKSDDGIVLENKQNGATVTVWGSKVVKITNDLNSEKARAAKNCTLTEDNTKKNGFEVSGTCGDRLMHQKMLQKKKNLVSYWVEYPKANEAALKPLVAKLSIR